MLNISRTYQQRNEKAVLTIERVQQLLDDPIITDDMAEEIRDGFRALIEDIIFPAWFEEKNTHKHE